jgi:hypothetical protein
MSEPEHAEEACAICGEPIAVVDLAEMHDPDNPEESGGVVHAECGMQAEWVVS